MEMQELHLMEVLCFNRSLEINNPKYFYQMQAGHEHVSVLIVLLSSSKGLMASLH